jgi:hypothetical protein
MAISITVTFDQKIVDKVGYTRKCRSDSDYGYHLHFNKEALVAILNVLSAAFMTKA